MATTTSIITTNPLKTDVLGRVTISPQQRERILDAFDASGMSGQKFAEHCGVKYTTFASWIQKRRKSRGEYPDTTSDPNEALIKSLTEITLELPTNMQSPQIQSDSITITFLCGAKLELTHQSQIPLVASLLNHQPHQNHA